MSLLAQSETQALPKQSPPEQRRWPRTECSGELLICPVREGVVGQTIVSHSADFSTMGLGLVHDGPMEKGEQFLVALKTRGGPPLPLLYTVVRCQPVGFGQYQIGAELVSVWNLEQFVDNSARDALARAISGMPE